MITAAIMSVTQATAPKASHAAQPDMANWSNTLTAVDAMAPTPRAGASASEAAANAPAECMTDGASGDTASQGNTPSASTNAVPMRKKLEERENSAVEAEPGAKTRAGGTDNDQQALPIFAAMLLSNTGATPQVTASATKGGDAKAEDSTSSATMRTSADSAAEELPASVVGDNLSAPSQTQAQARQTVVTQPAEGEIAKALAKPGRAASLPPLNSQDIASAADAQAPAATHAVTAARIGADDASGAISSQVGQVQAKAANISAAKTDMASMAASLHARGALQAAAVGGDRKKTTAMLVLPPGDGLGVNAGMQESAANAVAGTLATAATRAVVAGNGAVGDDSRVAGNSAAALAATISALHQAGQGAAVLRLDPPGLGALSVHVGLGQHGQVNVLFVPDTQAGAQALQAGLGGLPQALAQSGLTLGQVQIGGQFGHGAGAGGQNGQRQNWPRSVGNMALGNGLATPSEDDGGVSAYA